MREPRASVMQIVSSAALACLVLACPAAETPALPAAKAAATAKPQPKPAPRSAPRTSTRVLPAGREPALLLSASALWRFDEDGLTKVAAPPHELVDLVVGPEATLHLLTDTNLQVLRGDSFVELAPFGSQLEEVRSVALGPHGEIWVSTKTGVAQHTASGWVSSSAQTLGFAPGTTLGLAFDQSGRCWAVGPERAIYQSEGEWHETEKSIVDSGFALSNPTPSGTGPVHVNNNHRLTRLHAALFDSVLVDPSTTLDYELLSVGPEGHALVATPSCELGRVTPQPPTRIWRFAAKDYACDHADAIALDGQLRAWVASPAGLSVIEKGRELHEYPAKTLRGLEGPVRRIVVLGQGPALPSSS